MKRVALFFALYVLAFPVNAQTLDCRTWKQVSVEPVYGSGSFIGHGYRFEAVFLREIRYVPQDAEMRNCVEWNLAPAGVPVLQVEFGPEGTRSVVVSLPDGTRYQGSQVTWRLVSFESDEAGNPHAILEFAVLSQETDTVLDLKRITMKFEVKIAETIISR